MLLHACIRMVNKFGEKVVVHCRLTCSLPPFKRGELIFL